MFSTGATATNSQRTLAVLFHSLVNSRQARVCFVLSSPHSSRHARSHSCEVLQMGEDSGQINPIPRRPPPSAEFSPTTPPRFPHFFLLLLEQEHCCSRHGLLHSIAQIFSWPSEGIQLAVRYGCAAVHRLSVYEACIPTRFFSTALQKSFVDHERAGKVRP